MLFPILLGFIVSLAHYFSEHFNLKKSKFKSELTSLAAGVSVTYIFLQLLPEFGEWVDGSAPMYLFILIGFGSLHLTEKIIYQHAKGSHRRRELSGVHAIIILIYYFVAGITLATLASVSSTAALLFFIPLILHTISSSMTLHELHIRYAKNKAVQIILSTIVIIGTVIGVFVPFSSFIRAAFIGFIAGALFYIVIKEEVPSHSDGKPHYFIAGVLMYLIFISLQWLT